MTIYVVDTNGMSNAPDTTLHDTMRDVRTMTFERNRQETIDTYKNDWSIEKVERGILHDYYRAMGCFGTILALDFDLDETFEYQCRLDGNYLCTISHDRDDRITTKQMPGFQAYRLVVMWPRDGRKEHWTLQLMVWGTGEFRENPRGEKSVSSLLYDDKMVIHTPPMVNDMRSVHEMLTRLKGV